ncbi:DUF4062 domain-containing protein [Streptococcus sp. X16XC17]|uniref:hypothetical protein n=1 Tax=unclassified Streptococcus TaxID=2608887 RepID=UPI00066FD54C|nr:MULTISPECIES: hypothetical protein [unclassified Streptococcus]TCD45961.1 DUF4062 domain-containing protein [Streptococcus sp. X16XC17]
MVGNGKVRKPLSVFVSSKCDGKYRDIRNKIFEELNKLPLIEPFVYEEAPASSIPSREAYTLELEHTDLFVCIIDNADGVSETVMDEITKAQKIDLYQLYFFCSESNNNVTDLQKSLDGGQHPKYIVVECFRDIPEKVIGAINTDIVQRYSYKNFQQKENETESEVIFNGDAQSYSLKNSIKTSVISNHIMRTIGISFNPELEISEFDKRLLQFFKAIIKLRKFDFLSFDKLVKDILELHSEPIKGILELRFEVMKSYLKEDFERTITLLSDILRKSADDFHIPLWIANNIAIDLRTVINENDNLNNQWHSENEGQLFIDNRKEELHFPLLDRKEKLLQEQLNKVYFGSLNSNTQFNLQNMGMFDYLQEIFLLALLYGSITHLSIFIKDLIDTFSMLNRVYSDYDIQKELVRLMVVEGDRKELKRHMAYRSEQQLFISDGDITKVFDSIRNIPHIYRRYKALLVMMTEFSDYLNKETFDVEALNLIGYIIQWLREEIPTLNLESYVFSFLKKVLIRLENKSFIPIIDIIFKSKLRRFYRSIFDVMGRLDYSNFSKTEQNRIFGYLMSVFDDDKADANPYDKFGDAIICFSKQAAIDMKELERILEERYTKHYQEFYLLELNHQESAEDFIDLLLDRIDKDNLNQGLNGVYSYGGDDYGTIRNIIKQNDLVLSPNMLNKAIKTCLVTISVDRQKIGEKIHAVELLMLLYSKHVYSINWTEEVIDKIKSINIDEFKDYGDVLFGLGNTKAVLKLSLFLFLSIFDKEYNQLFINQLLMMKSDEEREGNRSLEVVIRFLKNSHPNDVDREVLTAISYFSRYSLNSKSIHLQQLAIYCLMNLTRFTCINELALNQISIYWDMATSEVKLVILSNFEILNAEIEFKKFLLAKAMRDNHYLVRERAEVLDERSLHDHHRNYC